VYSGIGIETDQGHFGIAQRDGGIEVLHEGKLVWASVCMLRPEDKRCKNCESFQPHDDHRLRTGTCRHDAPQPLQLLDDPDYYGTAVWPEVHEHYWCRKWERRVHAPGDEDTHARTEEQAPLHDPSRMGKKTW
jgi:hypothetical protein